MGALPAPHGRLREDYVTAAELILSPAYDLGLTEDELRQTNLEKLNTY